MNPEIAHIFPLDLDGIRIPMPTSTHRLPGIAGSGKYTRQAPPEDWPATFGLRRPIQKVDHHRGMARDLTALQRVLQVFARPERFPALAGEIASRLPDATGEQTYRLKVLQQLLGEVNERIAEWEEEWRAENAFKPLTERIDQ